MPVILVASKLDLAENSNDELAEVSSSISLDPTAMSSILNASEIGLHHASYSSMF